MSEEHEGRPGFEEWSIDDDIAAVSRAVELMQDYIAHLNYKKKRKDENWVQ